MKHNRLLSFFAGVLAIVACTPTYIVKPAPEKGKVDPANVSLLELCYNVQEQWEEDREVSRIYVVAHRANTVESFRQGIPDNSLPNIQHAIEAGADMVELDVRTTKDGQLVLMHNETINETTEGFGKVADLTLEEIRKFNMVRSRKVYRDEQNNTTKVPTLLEALQLTKDKVYVNLDLAGKSNDPKKILEAINAAGVAEQVMIFADYDELMSYQRLAPLVAIHPYINNVDDTDRYSGIAAAKLFQYGNNVYLNGTVQQFGVRMHEKGYLSYSNLLGEWDEALKKGDYTPLDKFIVSGSDFIQTDVAELVISYLKENDLR